jgi:hypothetical protein
MTIDYAIEENQKSFKIFSTGNLNIAAFLPNPDYPSPILSSSTRAENVLIMFVSQSGYIGRDMF